MDIILLTGAAECGKTTTANAIKKKLLTDHPKLRIAIASYATYVKSSATMLFGWDGKKDEKGRTHYSDEELAEFRELILEKLVKARHDLELLTEAYTNSNDNDTMDTSPTFKVLEEGYQVLSKEENARLAATFTWLLLPSVHFKVKIFYF